MTCATVAGSRGGGGEQGGRRARYTRRIMWAVLSTAAFLVFGTTAATIFDVLTRRERDEHPDAWFADGRPEVLRTPASMHIRGWPASIAFYQWAFRTPAWARTDPRARRLLVLYRGALLAAACACVVAIATIGR
jgi:hypothetical protein